MIIVAIATEERAEGGNIPSHQSNSDTEREQQRFYFCLFVFF